MRFHVVGLPHTVASTDFLTCAYTQKVLKFVRMMKSLGHEVYHYGGEKSVTDADENVTIITEEQRKNWWGENDITREFYAVEWKPEMPYWMEANRNAIVEINKRIQPKDFICVIAGVCQKPIADAFKNHVTVEFGIGYEGTFSKYRVFESYAFMHYIYGMEGSADGRYCDEVIPNYYDPNDFKIAEKRGNYFLYIGRIVSRKGLHIAAEACKKLGVTLKVVGQGATSYENGKLIAKELEVDGVEYLGTVGVEERAKLMSEALGTFVLTQYIGPFEGVSVESMLCGTPVITTDWGAFTENVVDGINGFRTRGFGEILWAAQQCKKGLGSPLTIRQYAIARFSMDTIKHRYQDYFQRLYDLWGDGWYADNYDPSEKRFTGLFT